MEDIIPLWIKLAYSGMVAVILPVYALRYGWRNYLWFSDIALVTTGVALWLESALLASMMAVGVLMPELLWSASFFGRGGCNREVHALLRLAKYLLPNVWAGLLRTYQNAQTDTRLQTG